MPAHARWRRMRRRLRRLTGPPQWRGPNPRAYLNWQQLLLVDPSFPHGVDADTVRRLVDNIGDASLSLEDAARLEPAHTQRLHLLSQVCVQYLAHHANCMADAAAELKR
eukprot:gene140-2860_t